MQSQYQFSSSAETNTTNAYFDPTGVDMQWREAENTFLDEQQQPPPSSQDPMLGTYSDDERDDAPVWNPTDSTNLVQMNEWTANSKPYGTPGGGGIFNNDGIPPMNDTLLSPFNNPIQSYPASPFYLQPSSFTVPLSPYDSSNIHSDTQSADTGSSASSQIYSPNTQSITAQQPITPDNYQQQHEFTEAITSYAVVNTYAIPPQQNLHLQQYVHNHVDSHPHPTQHSHQQTQHSKAATTRPSNSNKKQQNKTNGRQISPEHKTTPVKQACIACRKLKTQCDEQRPCTRCTKFGRECVDRTPEEIAQAKSRRSVKKKKDTSTNGHAVTTQATPVTAAVVAQAVPMEDTHMEARASNKRPNPSTTTPESAHGNRTLKSTVIPSGSASVASDTPPPLDSMIGLEPTAVNPASYANSQSATDAISAMLYSKCFLTVLIQLGLRDSILQNHISLETRQPPVTSQQLLEWHTQVNVMLLQTCDQLLPDDVTRFILHGLTEEQQNSALFLSSPLSAWARLSTRPFHYAIQPNTVVLDQHLRGTNNNGGGSVTLDPSLSDPNHARLKVEWLGAANISFTRWQRMLLSKLEYEYQLKLERMNMIHNGNGGGAAIPPTQQYQSSGTIFTPAIQGVCNDIPSMAISLEEDELSDRFSVLGIARCLAAPPPKGTEHDRVTNLHASWCPLGGTASLEQQDEDAAQDRKLKRTEEMNSVTHSGSGSSGGSSSSGSSAVSSSGSSASSSESTASSECLCALSTPLPFRLWTSDSFHSYFGWRRIDVERGMQVEGFRWNRRWYPPSTWPSAHQAQAAQAKLTLDMVAQQILRTMPDAIAVRRSSESISQLPPMTKHHAVESIIMAPSFLTRRGEVVTASTKALRVQNSDGDAEPSAVIISWAIPTTVKPTFQPTNESSWPDRNCAIRDTHMRNI